MTHPIKWTISHGLLISDCHFVLSGVGLNYQQISSTVKHKTDASNALGTRWTVVHRFTPIPFLPQRPSATRRCESNIAIDEWNVYYNDAIIWTRQECTGEMTVVLCASFHFQSSVLSHLINVFRYARRATNQFTCPNFTANVSFRWIFFRCRVFFFPCNYVAINSTRQLRRNGRWCTEK